MNILLTGGGTGGHIIPLLAVAHELKKIDPNVQLSYIGEKGGKFAQLTKEPGLFKTRKFIYAGKFRRYHNDSFMSRLLDVRTNLLNLRDVFFVLLGLIEGFFVLMRLRPDVIFIKGGYVGVPVGLAAALLKIPFITHDSDTVPGLANRIVGRWAKLHATGMPVEFYGYPKNKSVYVGIPVAEEFTKAAETKNVEEAKRILGLPNGAKLLVVTGGSQGSARLNQAMRSVVHQLLEEIPNLHIVHHVGRGNEAIYSSFNHGRLHIEPFIEAFAEVARASDLAVTRGGASSLAEFGMLGKPLIVVPSPFLANGHQLENAKHLAGEQAIVVLDEEEILKDPAVLHRTITEILNNASERGRLAKNLQNLTKKDAAREIAKLLVQL